MSNWEYVCDDIDATLRMIAEKARRYGWCIWDTEKDVFLAEPSLFPIIPEENIMTMVKAVLRRDCPKECDFSSKPHPMLQVGEGAYYKLCTPMLLAYLKERSKKHAKRT